MSRLRALSLWQPWAHLLAHGQKDYETRGWTTKYRGPVAIHAACKWSVRMAIQCYREPFFSMLSRAGIRFPAKCDGVTFLAMGFSFGAIIGVRDLVGVLPSQEVLPYLGPDEIAFGDFSHGRFAWRYEGAVPLPEPIPYVGRQGLFNVDDSTCALIERQVGSRWVHEKTPSGSRLRGLAT